MPTSIYSFPAFYPEEGAKNLEYGLNRLFSELYAEHPSASAIYLRQDLCLTSESSAGEAASVTVNQVRLDNMMNAVAAGYLRTFSRIVLDPTATTTGGFTAAVATRVNDWARSFRPVEIPTETYTLSLDFVNGIYRINS